MAGMQLKLQAVDKCRPRAQFHLRRELGRNASIQSRGLLLNNLRNRERVARRVVFGASLLSVLVFAVPGFPRDVDSPPQASTATISGRVSVASTQGVSNNLSAITVKLTGPAPATASQEAVSDTEGRFEFARLMPGSYKLEITVEGFKPWSATVILVAGQDAV